MLGSDQEGEEQEGGFGDVGVIGSESFGEAGKLGHRVRELEREELELESDSEPRLDTLLNVLVIVEDAVLKRERAGDEVREVERVGEDGDCGDEGL